MKITKVQVLINRNKESKVKAFCTVTFDDELVVTNIVIMQHESEGYYFVNFPKKLLKNKLSVKLVYPANKTFDRYVEDAVIDEYERLLNEDLTKTGA